MYGFFIAMIIIILFEIHALAVALNEADKMAKQIDTLKMQLAKTRKELADAYGGGNNE